MKKVTNSLILLLFVLATNSLISQTIKVKTLPDEIVPSEYPYLLNAVKNQNNEIMYVYSKKQFMFLDFFSMFLEENSMTLLKSDGSYKKLSQNIIVNSSTDSKKEFIAQAYFNNHLNLLGNRNYPNVNPKSIVVDEDGKTSKPAINYMDVKNKNAMSGSGSFAKYIFSPNNKYYASVYNGYIKAVTSNNKGLWVSLYDNNNNKVYELFDYKLGETSNTGDVIIKSLAITDEGELYFVANKELNNENKELIIQHFDLKGKLIAEKIIKVKSGVFRDYNITTKANNLVISGITQEGKELSKTNGHEPDYLNSFFYIEIGGKENSVIVYKENKNKINEQVVDDLVFKDGFIPYECIKIRDVIPNGTNTWVIAELMGPGGGGAFDLMIYESHKEIVVFNIDSEGNLIGINKIARKFITSEATAPRYSTTFVDNLKTYKYKVFNNNLFVFYNLYRETANAKNSTDMKTYPMDLSNKAKFAGYYSVINTKSEMTSDKSSSIFDDIINLKTFSQIDNNKILFQLGASKKIVEVTLE